MDFFKALQTAQILIDVIKALHVALTENTVATEKHAALLLRQQSERDSQVPMQNTEV